MAQVVGVVKCDALADDEKAVLKRALDQSQGLLGHGWLVKSVPGAFMAYRRQARLDLDGDNALQTRDGILQACLGATDQEAFVGSILDPAPSENENRAPPEDLASHGQCLLTATFSSARQQLLVFTDRHGLTQLYYAPISGGIAFSTSIAVLSELLDDALEIDAVSALEFLTYGHILADYTFYPQIRQLTPGSYLICESGSQPRVGTYYVPQHRETNTYNDIDKAAAQLAELTRRALARAIPTGADIRTGLGLTGGLDSRVLLGLAPNPSRLYTYTFGEAGCLDMAYARQLARIVGSSHHELHSDPSAFWNTLDDYFRFTGSHTDAGFWHIWYLSPKVASEVDVYMTAVGDVLTGGHSDLWQQILPDGRFSGRIAFERYRRQLGHLAPFSSLCSRDFVRGHWNRYRERFAEAFSGSAGPQASYLASRWNLFDLTHKQRRRINEAMSLYRNFVSLRIPYYDKDLARFWFSTPKRFRRRQRLYLHMICKALPELAAVPCTSTSGWPLNQARPQFGEVKVLGRLLGSPHRPSTGNFYRNVFSPPWDGKAKERLLDGTLHRFGVVQNQEIERCLEWHSSGRRPLTPFLTRLLTVRSAISSCDTAGN